MGSNTAIAAGIDRIGEHSGLFDGRRLGLVVNASSLDRSLTPTWRRLADLTSAQLVRLFAPEHGISGSVAAGEGLNDGIDPSTGLPVVALYGPRKRPAPEHLRRSRRNCLRPRGCGLPRLHLSLDAARIVLSQRRGGRAADRSGPAEPGRRQHRRRRRRRRFGEFRRLLRPALAAWTDLGRAARLYCSEQGLPAPSVVPCAGWNREPADPSAVWISPSPNLPSPESVLAYCGTVLIEGTALSEGRGTTRPFTTIGAPGLDADTLVSRLRERHLPGVLFQAVEFRPAESKHAGRTCAGITLHVTDRQTFLALPVVLEIFAFLRDRQPELLATTEFLDCLAGGIRMREWCNSPGGDPAELLCAWSDGHEGLSRANRPACAVSREPMNDPLFLGIDGGATKCRARIVDAEGRTLGEGHAGTANPRYGLQAAFDEILSATGGAIAGAGLPDSAIATLHAGLGLAGTGQRQDREAVMAHPHPFASVSLETDAHVACLGAYSGGDGAILILGTGSCGWSIVGGKPHRVGGLGFPIADHGSGAWLGLSTIRRALLAHDGVEPETPLSKAVMARFDDDTDAAVAWQATHSQRTTPPLPRWSSATRRPVTRSPMTFCKPRQRTRRGWPKPCWQPARGGFPSWVGWRPISGLGCRRPYRRQSSNQRETPWTARSFWHGRAWTRWTRRDQDRDG